MSFIYNNQSKVLLHNISWPNFYSILKTRFAILMLIGQTSTKQYTVTCIHTAQIKMDRVSLEADGSVPQVFREPLFVDYLICHTQFSNDAIQGMTIILFINNTIVEYSLTDNRKHVYRQPNTSTMHCNLEETLFIQGSAILYFLVHNGQVLSITRFILIPHIV